MLDNSIILVGPLEMARVEVRFHGRGGQGAVTAAELLAEAAILEGKFTIAFPEYGAERRGAPVLAFTRIDNERILEREPILEPDVVVVLDSSLDPKVYLKGLKDNGYAVINTSLKADELAERLSKMGVKVPRCIATVDATSIAIKHLKTPVVNTSMLGALVKATKIVELDNILRSVERKFSDRPHIARANVDAIKEAYSSVDVRCM